MTGSAAAEDCFPKVLAASAPAKAAPPKAAPARKASPPKARKPARQQARGPVARKPRVVAAAKPKPVQKLLDESSYAMRTGLGPPPRSVECDTKPSIQTALPPEAVPAAQRLLDEIAGPEGPPETPAPVELASAEAPVGGFPFGLPFGPGGGGGGFVGGPGGGGGGGGQPGGPGEPGNPGEPPVNPPVNPPVTPPPVNPPVTEPPVKPPVDPPPVTPPGPGGPPPTSAVPEPATWAMMIIGFFGLGGAIRSQRVRARLTEGKVQSQA